MNEEEIKLKVIIPFLQSIGFSTENMSFEKNFTIRLGTNKINAKDYISGRLDILVQLDNYPFLMWELKKDGHTITQKDIDQAISYSRLTDEITPFTIVSNGKDTKIFNTFTKAEINVNDFDGKYQNPSIQEAINLRFEALTEIICYSQENLINFLKYINNCEIEKVSGKYIKDIYVDRLHIKSSFNNFIKDNNTKMFLITGESGSGKTNIMCNLAENNMNDSFILFYNACFIGQPILNKIMSDFDFNFDEELKSRQLFNRINTLAKEQNKNFIIFIDAIDELSINNPSIEIEELLNTINGYSNIKICLSCKDSFIDDFEQIRNNDTSFKTIPQIKIKVDTFEDLEKRQMIRKYSKFYNVKIEERLTDILINNYDNGFLFRIIFEAYQNSEIKDIPEDITIIEKYIETIAKNYNLNKSDLIYTLRILGEAIEEVKDDEYNFIQLKEDELDILFREKNIPISLETLLKMNILQNYNSAKTSTIDFYFKPLSSYAIAILSERLNTKKGKDFINTLHRLHNNKRCLESLRWYDKHIKIKDLEDVKTFKIEYGEKLINEYRTIVNHKFPSIKDKFELDVDINKVGIALSDDDEIAMLTYAFFEMRIDSPNVQLIDFRDRNSFNKYGIRGYSSNMYGINIEKIVKDNLFKIVEDHRLDISSCKELMIEEVLNSVFIFGNEYGFNYKLHRRNWIPKYEDFLPLNLNELINKVLKFNIQKLAEDNLLKIEKEKYDDIVKDILSGNLVIPEVIINYSGKGKIPIYSLVNKAIILEDDYSIKDIQAPHLLMPKNEIEINTRNISDMMIEAFTKDELDNYLKDILIKFFENYIKIVENNFDVLKEKMPFYQFLKNGAIIDFYLVKGEPGWFGKYSRTTIYKKNDTKQIEINIIQCNKDEDPYPSFDSQSYHSWIGGAIDEFFFNGHSSNHINRLNILNNLVYKKLNEDLKKALEKTNLEI